MLLLGEISSEHLDWVSWPVAVVREGLVPTSSSIGAHPWSRVGCCLTRDEQASMKKISVSTAAVSSVSA